MRGQPGKKVQCRLSRQAMDVGREFHWAIARGNGNMVILIVVCGRVRTCVYYVHTLSRLVDSKLTFYVKTVHYLLLVPSVL